MENIFNFNYYVDPLLNRDQSKSRFAVVYGDKGKIIHCKKDSYEIIPTSALSGLGEAFMSRYGYDRVTPFIHKDGEVIGLNVCLTKMRKTHIGDKDYRAVITVPNNGGGRGYLSIKEKRLICMNGMTRTKTLHQVKSIKIPHSLDYREGIDLMEAAVIEFKHLIDFVEEMDVKMDNIKLDKYQVLRHLNEWFFTKEMPLSHKENMTLDQFRELLVKDPDEIQSIERYNQLKEAYNAELKNNQELGLDLSLYTVFASVTNYLSRRLERSGSKAPEEVQSERQSAKLSYFDNMVMA